MIYRTGLTPGHGNCSPALYHSHLHQRDRKLLVVMTMESRCRICPVIRKILRSWHSLRTERAQQPIAEGDSTAWNVPDFQPQAFPLILRLWCPLWCRPWPLLLGKRPQKHILQASLAYVHMNTHSTVPHLPPSPDVQFRQIVFSFLKEEGNRRWSPKPFPPLKPFKSVIHP